MDQTGKLDSRLKEKIIQQIIENLTQHYVFLDVGEKMSNTVEQHFKNGKYLAITDADSFCNAVTKDLVELSKDKHIKLIYRPEAEPSNLQKKMIEEEKRRGRVENYGFHKVERLSGNVGYIDVRKFYSVDLASETASNVMNIVSNTDALIVDLRKNGGGRIDMVAYLLSYFFEEPTLISTIYDRTNDAHLESWTLKNIHGEKYTRKPVFVLTSNFTFSGGEAFAYHLKYSKRAKIIGEVTGGGANPVMFAKLSGNIRFKIPNRRVIHPVTNSNWEGTGVIPDLQIDKDTAFDYAYKKALSFVRERYSTNQDYLFLLKEIDTLHER